ncbi:MAG: flagellar biosynthetic protein FliQ [Candidatus Hydrogenedentota bacterium]|nr:MAG: flagellar biosynthetic protein FliQ [Candidatus Hydrogenedentota bacterium]
MTQHMAVDLTRDVLTMTIIIASPMLVIGLIVGLMISIIQTTTSIQEQTLTFVPKLFAILISVAIFGPWMIRMMTEYVTLLITTMSRVAP